MSAQPPGGHLSRAFALEGRDDSRQPKLPIDPCVYETPTARVNEARMEEDAAVAVEVAVAVAVAVAVVVAVAVAVVTPAIACDCLQHHHDELQMHLL
jgi:hypothetical protein